MPRKYIKVDRKEGYILGIKISITSRDEVLDFVRSRLDSKDKFYIVTPNPENLLMATKDWLLAKAIRRSDLSIPDGIGLSQAYKFLSYRDRRENIFRPFILFAQGIYVGALTLYNKGLLMKGLEIIKGRELFLDIIKIANERKLKVYLFGGQGGEQVKAKEVLEKQFPNITFKTNYQFPQYNRNCKPSSLENRKMHKNIIGGIKLFEPDLIFVAMNTPKQEKWIYRNFFRLNATGAMAVGGTFNYVAGNMKMPPKWMEKVGLEWLWRLINEPKRIIRIINAVIVFPITVFYYKLTLPLHRIVKKTI